MAKQLAEEWEAKLAPKQRLEQDYRRFLQAQARTLSPQERKRIEQLAHDLPSLWQAATTRAADRQEIIRQRIEQLVVEVEGESERVQVTITWVGGYVSKELTLRPVNRLELSYYPELCARVKTLAEAGLSAEKIASILDQEGFKPPQRFARFGRQGVTDLLHRRGI